ncbi:MAG: DUF1566 domain-containing protein [Flavobacteriales bacterium]|nr:DUF1566 domain-containing protein [Flavobacteriales bacterium]MBK6883855.1 DUF1566 domain-containing protein [Flavobacteriales bacterium]MBK7100247.1 DUF1566 domain-containing protein [Flavobacteriales bacterium]MBK7110940.1 DUF1566 domain-containing protein [Flavobacteriales bacterium]MBK7481319.1 DUF1566 domain-containing protein [Flavobacteriales bacterium]
MKSSTVTILCIACALASYSQITYPIVDTDVSDFYNNSTIISTPSIGSPFYGQDATYNGNQPSYTNNGDGTVTDNVTGLTWLKSMGGKISYHDAVIKADTMTSGGHTDWRIPTIKELYSLALFTGRCFGDLAVDKFIDTTYFDQPIGDVTIGEREIDGQVWSNTHYVSHIMLGDTAIFGYNFIDGRLKGYPKYSPMNGTPNKFYFRMVRGNTSYGTNSFIDNGDGTITDNATGLMWQQSDNGTTYNWENALSYAENLTLTDHSDWRLPNAKELQSIVDYTRSPGATSSPAIDPLFYCTPITDPNGNSGQYGYYWSSSPLQDGPNPYSDAVYFCFGKAQGLMELPPNSGNLQLLDVHGAGAQRNDPKTGDPADFPNYFGPQGDVRYAYNFIRCVRNTSTPTSIKGTDLGERIRIYPNPAASCFRVDISPEIELTELELSDLQGKLVQSIHASNEKEILIDVSTVKSGTYLLTIHSTEGSDSRTIIVK